MTRLELAIRFVTSIIQSLGVIYSSETLFDFEVFSTEISTHGFTSQAFIGTFPFLVGVIYRIGQQAGFSLYKAAG